MIFREDILPFRVEYPIKAGYFLLQRMHRVSVLKTRCKRWMIETMLEGNENLINMYRRNYGQSRTA
jgi:hypothetical protein